MQGRGSAAGRGGAAEITRGVTSGSSGVHTSAAPPCGPVITGLAPEPGPGAGGAAATARPRATEGAGRLACPPFLPAFSPLLSVPFFLHLSTQVCTICQVVQCDTMIL